MENEQIKYSQEDSSAGENNIINVVYRYLVHWKLFLLALIVSVLIAKIYLRYQAPMYEVSASILIKDDKKGGAISELSAFEDLGLLKGVNNIDNEIEVLKSRSLMMLVAKELRLNIQYFIKKSPFDIEKFDNSPVTIRFADGDTSSYHLNNELTITLESKTSYKITNEKGEKSNSKLFGETIETELGKIILYPNLSEINEFLGMDVKVVVTPLKAVVDDYRGSIIVVPVNKTSNVIELSLKDPLKVKAEAIVNNLIKQHNADAIADKNQVSKNTANFINDRVKFITSELSTVEEEAESFKTNHKLIDVESEAGLFLKTGSDNEIELLQTNTQVKLSEYMYEYILQHTAPSELIPANLGLNDPAVGTMIASHNMAVLERNRILKYSSEINPVIENLNTQLIGLRNSLKESLLNYKNSLLIKLKELNKQESGINSKIATVPKYEREYRIIQRQQQIKETLYLYLLQKREETNIALAVTVANAKIIDNAYSNGIPVSPNKRIIYLAALLLGFVIPVMIFYVIDVLDSKVHGKRDIDKIGLPFLGDIPYVESDKKIVVSKGDHSGIAEAFRLLRTNVDFIMNMNKPKGRTIFVTSTLAKEGKSFVALNLAAIIANSGKKVLLVGMDLRAPKILKYLGLTDKVGLSNYISDKDINLSEVIFAVPEIENLDLLPSGTIPPNPAELLMSDRVQEMFDKVKEMYDYIIIDTAPVGLVTDTLLLGKYADSFVYVVRAHYLQKEFLYVPENAHKEKKLPNLAILMNGTNLKKGYGYGYGYGYGGYGYGKEKPKSKWRALFSK